MSDEPVRLGVFDSGVGGLSVLRAIRAELPREPALYFADQLHVPYGSRSLDEVREFSIEITRFLVRLGVKVIVVACNTASAAALHPLRTTFPGITFVGMEPAVKPAAEYSKTKVVGVLATPATFHGALYASVVDRFAKGVTVLQDTCPGLVGEIEAGRVRHPEARKILEKAIRPMMEKGIDAIVLGCTHYPLVIPLIQEIAGSDIRVIDPAPAVARQAARMLERFGAPTRRQSEAITFFSSSPNGRLGELLPAFLGEEGEVRLVTWHGGTIKIDGG